MNNSIRIPTSVIADVLEHARNEAPRECCGLLVGVDAIVTRSVRTRNIEEGVTRYRIDPQDHFAAIRAARAEGLQVVGAYHSHPTGAAVPSASDIAEATSGPDFADVIVSLNREDVRAYRYEDGAAVPLVIDLVSS